MSDDFLTKRPPPRKDYEEKLYECPVCKRTLWGAYYYEVEGMQGHSYAPGSLIYVTGFCSCTNVHPAPHYAEASSFPEEARAIQPKGYCLKCEHCGGRILQEYWWWKNGEKWIPGRERCVCRIGGYVTKHAPQTEQPLGNEQEVMGP